MIIFGRFNHCPTSFYHKSIWKSVHFALAIALLFSVGTVGFYACSNKGTVTEDVKPQRTVRNNKTTTVFVDFQVPTSLQSATQVADRVQEQTINYTDSLGTSVTGISRVTFDAQNKVVKMQLSQSLVDYFDVPVDAFLDFVPVSSVGSPCPCDVRRNYWYNVRNAAGKYELAREERLAGITWDVTWSWLFGCYEKDVPGGC